jgi:hypothetical protein
MRIALAGDTVQLSIEEAVALLLGYPPETVSFYDLGPPSALDAITPTDIGRLIVIEGVGQKVAVDLLLAGQNAPWGLVPHGSRLEDADPDGELYGNATTLFEHFDTVPGVGTAIASKLLHLKRPSFFPLLDNVVRDLYHRAAADHYGLSTKWQKERPRWDGLYWAAVRDDLLDRENQSGLRAIRSSLRRLGTDHAMNVARLTDLRLLDILAWSAERAERELTG